MILVVPSAATDERDLPVDVDFDPRRRAAARARAGEPRPSAANVIGPAWPSASSPSYFWNAITAANVAFE